MLVRDSGNIRLSAPETKNHTSTFFYMKLVNSNKNRQVRTNSQSIKSIKSNTSDSDNIGIGRDTKYKLSF